MKEQAFFTVKDVGAQDFINAYATYLKKNNKLDIPKWTEFVKTGPAKELSPYNEDWVYIRVASVARKIYMRGHLGMTSLKHIYGGAQRNGSTKPRHRAAGGKIIRWALQQLEKLGVLQREQTLKSKKGSRVISKTGQIDLNRIATEFVKSKKTIEN